MSVGLDPETSRRVEHVAGEEFNGYTEGTQLHAGGHAAVQVQQEFGTGQQEYYTVQLPGKAPV